MSAAPGEGLHAALLRLLHGRVVIMGIGNVLRGDDAVGCEVIARLRQHIEGTRAGVGGRLTLIDAEEIPESWLGPAVAARPDVVLLVDAVDMRLDPGSAVLLPAAALGGVACCTHRTPLQLLAHYLAVAAGADVHLLGIQPASVAPGAGVHPAVCDAARETALILLEVLARTGVVDWKAPVGPEAIAC